MEPELLPLLQCISGAVFQQENDHVHVALKVQIFFHSRHFWLFRGLFAGGLIHVGDLQVIGRLFARTVRRAQNTTKH